jgi:hypothetical protein
MKNPLIVAKVGLEQEIKTLERPFVARLEPDQLKTLILQTAQVENWVSENNMAELKTFLLRVGSNRVLRGQTLTVAFKEPWNFLVTAIAECQKTDDAVTRNSLMWRFFSRNRTCSSGPAALRVGDAGNRTVTPAFP